MANKKGKFIVLEGIDGCGKSTQAMMVYSFLKARGFKVVMLREPGSTDVAEKIRSILLDKKTKIENVTELLLYEAARFEITAKEIQPAMQRAREAIAKTGKCAVVNVWVDPNEYAPGTKAQTMYK